MNNETSKPLANKLVRISSLSHMQAISQTKQATAQKQPEYELMIPEQYAQIKHAVPYIYHFKKGQKELTYFGAEHTNNPRDLVFKLIKEKFNQINPDLALVEDITNIDQNRQETKTWFKERVPEEIIEIFGDRAFIIYLALQRHIDVSSPEPKFEDEIKHLVAKGYSKDQIFGFYFASQIIRYHQISAGKNQPDFKDFIKPYLDKLKKATGCTNYDFSPEYFSKVSNNLFGFGLDVSNPHAYADKIDPIPWSGKKKQSITNLIARESKYYRDMHMLGKIAECLKMKNRIFILFNSRDAVMQEKAVRRIFEKL